MNVESETTQSAAPAAWPTFTGAAARIRS